MAPEYRVFVPKQFASQFEASLPNYNGNIIGKTDLTTPQGNQSRSYTARQISNSIIQSVGGEKLQHIHNPSHQSRSVIFYIHGQVDRVILDLKKRHREEWKRPSNKTLNEAQAIAILGELNHLVQTQTLVGERLRQIGITPEKLEKTQITLFQAPENGGRRR